MLLSKIRLLIEQVCTNLELSWDIFDKILVLKE